MQSALERDQTLALLEAGHAQMRAAALSPATCEEHQ